MLLGNGSGHSGHDHYHVPSEWECAVFPPLLVRPRGISKPRLLNHMTLMLVSGPSAGIPNESTRAISARVDSTVLTLTF